MNHNLVDFPKKKEKKSFAITFVHKKGRRAHGAYKRTKNFFEIFLWLTFNKLTFTQAITNTQMVKLIQNMIISNFEKKKWRHSINLKFKYLSL